MAPVMRADEFQSDPAACLTVANAITGPSASSLSESVGGDGRSNSAAALTLERYAIARRARTPTRRYSSPNASAHSAATSIVKASRAPSGLHTNWPLTISGRSMPTVQRSTTRAYRKVRHQKHAGAVKTLIGHRPRLVLCSTKYLTLLRRYRSYRPWPPANLSPNHPTNRPPSTRARFRTCPTSAAPWRARRRSPTCRGGDWS